MADFTTIRAALATQITARTGLRTQPDARDSVDPPVAIVLPGQPLVTYGATMDGTLDINLTVLLIISDAQTSERTQKTLDAYLGIGAGETQSIAGAIMADPSLGGAVHFCEPMTVSSYGRIDYSGVTYFGARVNVRAGAI